MYVYKYIYNPINGEKININSKLGKQILKFHINSLNGGSRVVPQELALRREGTDPKAGQSKHAASNVKVPHQLFLPPIREHDNEEASEEKNDYQRYDLDGMYGYETREQPMERIKKNYHTILLKKIKVIDGKKNDIFKCFKNFMGLKYILNDHSVKIYYTEVHSFFLYKVLISLGILAMNKLILHVLEHFIALDDSSLIDPFKDAPINLFIDNNQILNEDNNERLKIKMVYKAFTKQRKLTRRMTSTLFNQIPEPYGMDRSECYILDSNQNIHSIENFDTYDLSYSDDFRFLKIPDSFHSKNLDHISNMNKMTNDNELVKKINKN